MSIDDADRRRSERRDDNVHTDVESARGGSRGDVLVGSSAANQLFGLGGPDSLDGGTGPDVLSGGGAVDTATYASRTAPLEVSLNGIANDGEITANELDNVLEDVENVVGGSSNDSFFGSPAANRFTGGLGNDFFDGATGPDVFQGGGNYDTVDYSSRSIRVAVSIDGAANDGTDADTDGIGEEGDNVAGRHRGPGRGLRQRPARRQRRPELHRGPLGEDRRRRPARSRRHRHLPRRPRRRRDRGRERQRPAFYDDHPAR